MGLLKLIFDALLQKPHRRTAAPTIEQKQEYERFVRVNKQLDNLNAAIDQERARREMSMDELGEAAEAKQQALNAVKEKRFDDAWSLFHKQKLHLLNHASKCNFTKAQTLAIDSSVHANLANILRLEKLHTEALVHILYSACAGGANKSIEKKVVAYFNRAGFRGVSLSALNAFIDITKVNPDFRTIQGKVQEWGDQS